MECESTRSHVGAEPFQWADGVRRSIGRFRMRHSQSCANALFKLSELLYELFSAFLETIERAVRHIISCAAVAGEQVG